MFGVRYFEEILREAAPESRQCSRAFLASLEPEDERWVSVETFMGELGSST